MTHVIDTDLLNKAHRLIYGPNALVLDALGCDHKAYMAIVAQADDPALAVVYVLLLRLEELEGGG